MSEPHPHGLAEETRRRLGGTFAAGGEQYDRLRPGYPAGAVDWLVGSTGAGDRVADVGAGTGKLTAALVERGLDVVAVDPSADMLAQLRRRLPGLETIEGTGEATGLPAASIRLATFAQSWHWVEAAAGAAELRRVVVPNGSVAMVWNFLDVEVPWVAELARIWHTLADRESIDADRHAPELGVGWGPVESLTVTWEHATTVADLAGLVTTRSYYLAAAPAEQDRIRTAVDAFFRRHLGVGSDSPQDIGLPYRTHGYRVQRTGGAVA